MRDLDLCHQILGVQAPWEASEVDVAKRLDNTKTCPAREPEAVP